MRTALFRRVIVNLTLVGIVATTVSAGTSLADPGPASEPAPAGLERFYHQPLAWKPCGDKDLDRFGGQCADVTVPLDYGRPDGRTISVAISRLKATDPAKRRGVVLTNPGGPGGPG